MALPPPLGMRTNHTIALRQACSHPPVMRMMRNALDVSDRPVKMRPNVRNRICRSGTCSRGGAGCFRFVCQVGCRWALFGTKAVARQASASRAQHTTQRESLRAQRTCWLSMVKNTRPDVTSASGRGGHAGQVRPSCSSQAAVHGALVPTTDARAAQHAHALCSERSYNNRCAGSTARSRPAPRPTTVAASKARQGTATGTAPT